MEAKKYTTEMGFNVIEYIYTEQEKMEMENNKIKFQSDRDKSLWNGQGTIQGSSNYGKFGDGGQ